MTKNYQTSRPCIFCETVSAQRCYHHIKSRKSGGVDNEDNLLPVCLACHNLVHNKGLNWFSKNPMVKQWLIEHNWRYCQIRGKWVYENTTDNE